MSYTTISIEGGLFPPDLLERISLGDGGIKGQATGDFGLPPSRRLLDEMQRSFSDARKYWDAFSRRLERSRESRTTLTREVWMAGLFELLGFLPLEYQRAAVEAGGASFPISHRTHSAENAPPIHIVAVDQPLDERGPARRTPHALVQDFLNRSEALWGVVTNGAKLRLLRDSARLSKPTYLEFDIQAMIEGNAYSEFVVLYRLLHATRFPSSGVEPHECLLEGYYTQGIEEGGRVREKLRDGVKSALEVLGTTLVEHPRNDVLRDTLRSGRLDEAGYYRQLLNFVYRMLFLMVTEERKLLSTGAHHERQTIYDRYYSITRLRDRAERYFAGDDHCDLWEGLAQTFRLFRDETAAKRLGLSPLNGELFRSSACRDIESVFCPNRSFLAAMRHLSTFDDNGVRRRVNYAHLDVEEFGSVYESLLDYRPVVQLGDASFVPHRFELAAGTERKQTGSYYTPPELVHELIDSALVPVIEDRLAAAKTPESKEGALLALRVCDPASGSGHFLLAAARRIAHELAKVRTGEEEPGLVQYRTAIRDVVRSCIYAVDKNPLAVDLCKVALWIEGHAAGLPLGFLDHHIKCGDSLVGVSDLSALTNGIPDDAYKTVTGDDKEAAKLYRQRNKQERTGQRSMLLETPQAISVKLGEDFAVFGALDERSPTDVQAKEELYQQLRGSGTRWWDVKTACDLWTHAFFAPLRTAGPDGLDHVPTTDNVRNALQGRNTRPQLNGEANAASQVHPFFHWPLEFPDVFERGGFDVVLGNPPWDQVQLDPREFFATRDHEVAEQPNMASRKRAIQRLATTNPALHSEYESAVSQMNGVQKFIHASTRFPKTSYGRLNSAPLFAEQCLSLVSTTGKAGIIVPTGIATDSFNQYFFADLVDRRSLVSLYDFENREGVFPSVHRSYKFCLLTLSGADRPSQEAEFAFFLHRAEQLQDAERRFVLAPQDFALFNPNTRTCPIFRTRRDTDIASKMYRRAGVFWRESHSGEAEVNPWGVRFQLMFMMNTDSHLFRTREQLEQVGWRLEGNVFVQGEERYLPLYEAKLFHQYDHRFATFEGVSDKDLLGGNAREVTPVEKADPEAVVIPRYWVPEEEVEKRLDKREETSGTLLDRHSNSSQNWLATRSTENRQSDRPEDGNLLHDSYFRVERFRDHYHGWLIAFRDIARATDHRTSIFTAIPGVAMSNQAPLIHIEYSQWLQAFRGITNATNERTMVSGAISPSGVGNSAPVMTYEHSVAIASALILANLNSLPLDWAARLSVGGTHMNFFIVKQLPVLPPETHLEKACQGMRYVELVVPRILELTYTAHDLEGFAQDLGYDGPPFTWDDERRHRLKCELDAIYAHMYQLERADLEWILDAAEPSQSFPGLKRNEMRAFGEYRTQRYVLQAYDQLARGEFPNLEGQSR